MKDTVLGIPYHLLTPTQRRVGGLNSGATRRLNNQSRDKRIRKLDAPGTRTQSLIAQVVGCSQSTVSRVLRGVTRTCLDLADTLASINPYPRAKAIMHEVSVTTGVSVVKAVARMIKRVRGKKRWNFCRLDCQKEHRHHYGPRQPAPVEQPHLHRWVWFFNGMICPEDGYCI